MIYTAYIKKVNLFFSQEITDFALTLATAYPE